MIRRILTILIILTLAALVRPAMAQYAMSESIEPNAWLGPFDATWQETVGGNTVDYSASGFAAGPQTISFVGTPPPNYPKSFEAYCVDMYHWDMTPAEVYVDPFTAVSNLTDENAALDGQTKAQYNLDLDKAAYLVDTYNPVVQSAPTTLLKEEDGAALQFAIWEIMAGPGSDFTFTDPANSVSPSVFSTIESLSSTYYNSVGNNVGNGTFFQFDRQVDGNGGQDLLGQAITPEGSSLTLLLIALAAPLGIMALRLRRQARTRS